MGPWIFSKHQRLLVERPSAKIHFEKWPQKKKVGKLGRPQFSRKWLFLLWLFIDSLVGCKHAVSTTTYNRITRFSAKNKYVAPYGDSRGFDTTELSGKIFCVEKTPRLQFSVSPNSGIFKIHDFWHSWKVPSSPNDPWTSRWVLGFFSKHTRGFWLNCLRRKYLVRNDTKKKIVSGKLKHIPTSSFV